MLHIVLTILKMIGIMLASILGLVLLLLCLLLFIPIRYRASGSKTKESIRAGGRISWLLGAVKVDLTLEDKDFQYHVRLLGIRLEQILSLFEKISNLFKHKRKKRLPEQSESLIDALENNKVQTEEEDVKEFGIPDADNDKLKKTLGIQTTLNDTSDQHTGEGSPQSKKSISDLPGIITEKVRVIFQSIIQVFKKIMKRISDIRLTICSVCDKIKYWVNLLQEQQAKESIELVKRQLVLLVKHILPRKLQGDVIFGFEDPSKTGQLLGVICVFYPLYYKQINISPDFTQTIFLGDISFKGRIYLFVLVKIAVRIYFDRNIQYIKKKITKK